MQDERPDQPPADHDADLRDRKHPHDRPDRTTDRADGPDEVKPDEDTSPWLKEGAGAPDAADIEDPERQL